ncbi:MAG: epoxyqueuosine reductase QueH [Candidatus Omnitrophota bacterium]
MSTKLKLLLHVCCAPCCTYPIKALQTEYEVELFFYNPNIHPEEEYNTRLEEAREYANKIGVKFHELSYDSNIWFNSMKGLEDEPEGGARCEVCYRIRLGKTAQFAIANKVEHFATTLSTSPHKRAETINRVGQTIAEMHSLDFYEADFKKNDGFKIATKMADEAGLYRQTYCGCIYSKR